MKQNGVDHRLVVKGDRRDLCRYGEDDVEVGYRQQLGLPLGQPFGPGQPLALRAQD